MNLAGLDIGTTGCKLSVFTPDGGYLGCAYRAYPSSRTEGEHEIDAADIWAAVREVMREVAASYPNISGLGVTSFGESFVLLDDSDIPLCPVMLYSDPRGGEECQQLSDKVGEAKIIGITGVKPDVSYSLPKLMWLRTNRPVQYARAKRVLLMQDYIVYLLTGTAQIDHSLAARTMAFDINRLEWSETLQDAAGIDAALLSRPVPTGTVAGPLRRSFAESFGLSGRTTVVSVSHDQVAAAVGSGVFDSGRTVDGAGTVECLTPVFTGCDRDRLAQSNYCAVPFITPGSYVTYAYSYTGGALAEWFVTNLAGGDTYTDLESGWNGEPTGLLVLPHFAGAATPYMDAGSRGAIVGLELSHTKQDIYLSLLEGVCYEMRLNAERLAEAGVTVAPLRAVGGGANSRVWTQMKADVLGLPVTALRTNEAGAVGCAMWAGLATGAFATLTQAAEAMVEERETFYPRAEAHRRYAELYGRYKNLYAAVRPLM